MAAAGGEQHKPERASLIGRSAWVRVEIRCELTKFCLPGNYLVRVLSPESGAYHYFSVHESQMKLEG